MSRKIVRQRDTSSFPSEDIRPLLLPILGISGMALVLLK